MSIAIVGVIAVLFAVAAVSFFVVRRVMRLAFRLALVGALLIALLVGAVVLWYNFGGAATSSPQTERRSTGTPRRTPVAPR
ncbi:MAG: hypothetical protein ABR577_04250 [Pyrinomonadaceae bacterium]